MVQSWSVHTHSNLVPYFLGHTFDYEPPVDKCGGGDCPAELPLNSATLMSYCNFCDGEKANESPSFQYLYHTTIVS